MKESIFKASDVRGVYPEEMDFEAATLIAHACAHMFPDGEIIVAHDVRHGSKELAEVTAKALQEGAMMYNKNFTIREIGLSSTPMYYFLVNHFKAVGGCMITASHNPKNYNGMKVVSAGASMIQGTKLLEYIKNHDIK